MSTDAEPKRSLFRVRWFLESSLRRRSSAFWNLWRLRMGTERFWASGESRRQARVCSDKGSWYLSTVVSRYMKRDASLYSLALSWVNRICPCVRVMYKSYEERWSVLYRAICWNTRVWDGQTWWHTLSIPVLGRLRQKIRGFELEVVLGKDWFSFS